MTWQRQLVEAARLAVLDDPRVIELRVTGSAADPGSGALDAWSDVDLAVLLDPAADPSAGSDWLARFGEPWALTRHRDADLDVQRVVYTDGRRVDLVSSCDPTAVPVGRLLHRRPATLSPGPPVDSGQCAPGTVTGAEELMDVRFTAALAVVKLARADLLIGFHLGLEVVRRCLVQAMVLRDRDTGSTSHRSGGPRNEVVAQLGTLREHPWTAAGGIALVLGATRIYDDLATQLDPDHVSDWSGLTALVRQARTQLDG